MIIIVLLAALGDAHSFKGPLLVLVRDTYHQSRCYVILVLSGEMFIMVIVGTNEVWCNLKKLSTTNVYYKLLMCLNNN